MLPCIASQSFNSRQYLGKQPFFYSYLRHLKGNIPDMTDNFAAILINFSLERGQRPALDLQGQCWRRIFSEADNHADLIEHEIGFGRERVVRGNTAFAADCAFLEIFRFTAIQVADL